MRLQIILVLVHQKKRNTTATTIHSINNSSKNVMNTITSTNIETNTDNDLNNSRV